jgi:acetate---CoA ligase (ADP-forming) subunit beta
MTAASIIGAARGQGRTLLNEIESKQILEDSGVPVASARLATSADEAVTLAGQIGYPVVLKIMSEDIPHKSDVGGVALNLNDADAVRSAYERVLSGARNAQPDARIDGVSVQKQARPGAEIIIGMTKDPQFGPVLMFGLGGVLVEVLKDVSFRIVPLEPRDAKEMVQEIKGLPLLQGYRGSEPADLAAVELLILKVSEFVQAHPEIDELDLNPVFAYRDGAIAVDARVVLSRE